MRLSKIERHAQLLETARMLIREAGTDALTLAAVAERAGVSRPIAYNHFGTRSGLMIALYKEINDRQVEALDRALRQTPASLDSVARVIADAYMGCHIAVGPEWHAIAAALKGDAEMDAYQRELVAGHAAFYAQAFRSISGLPFAVIERRCMGIVGAAEMLSDAMVREVVSREVATDDLASLIVSWLSPSR